MVQNLLGLNFFNSSLAVAVFIPKFQDKSHPCTDETHETLVTGTHIAVSTSPPLHQCPPPQCLLPQFAISGV